MFDQNFALHESLGPGGPDVVLVQHVEHAGAHHTHLMGRIQEARVTAGRTKWAQVSDPEMGSHRSHTPKMMISMMPNQ